MSEQELEQTPSVVKKTQKDELRALETPFSGQSTGLSGQSTGTSSMQNITDEALQNSAQQETNLDSSSLRTSITVTRVEQDNARSVDTQRLETAPSLEIFEKELEQTGAATEGETQPSTTSLKESLNTNRGSLLDQMMDLVVLLLKKIEFLIVQRPQAVTSTDGESREEEVELHHEDSPPSQNITAQSITAQNIPAHGSTYKKKKKKRG